jgi:hypothetical protein
MRGRGIYVSVGIAVSPVAEGNYTAYTYNK